jgi:hypothetical protein
MRDIPDRQGAGRGGTTGRHVRGGRFWRNKACASAATRLVSNLFGPGRPVSPHQLPEVDGDAHNGAVNWPAGATGLSLRIDAKRKPDKQVFFKLTELPVAFRTAVNRPALYRRLRCIRRPGAREKMVPFRSFG